MQPTEQAAHRHEKERVGMKARNKMQMWIQMWMQMQMKTGMKVVSPIVCQQMAHQKFHPDGGRAPKIGVDLNQSTSAKTQFDNMSRW